MKKQIERKLVEHNVYEFSLSTEATIFYNGCRNKCANGIYKDKEGIITISGKTVHVPTWMPISPYSYLSKQTVEL